MHPLFVNFISMRRERCGRPLFNHVGATKTEFVKFEPVPPDSLGPASRSERLCWFTWLWTHLDGGQRDRLVRNLKLMGSSSAFSGFGGWEIVLWFLVIGVNWFIPDAIDLIRSVNAGDLAPDRRQVLENLHPAIRPHHLTRCFFQRMPPPERAKILKSMPTATDHDDAKRLAYQHQYEQLKEVWASKGKF